MPLTYKSITWRQCQGDLRFAFQYQNSTIGVDHAKIDTCMLKHVWLSEHVFAPFVIGHILGIVKCTTIFALCTFLLRAPHYDMCTHICYVHRIFVNSKLTRLT
ncbi:hypothetical protein KSP39_PZI021496 [Platanthera zijinensis]|uniref:Uncharacterized protein n=1 Tax=Platanthera zijinensis TaxID=2320716 RepID=A0AAP0AYX6_9ASPA